MSKLQSQSSDTRRRLIEAAIDLLNQRGLAGTTFVDVAKRAGLSRGAVHHHYASRTELLEDVLDHISASLTRDVQAQLQSVPGASPSLNALVDFAWEQMNGPAYLAYQQISSGLRGDMTDRPRLAGKLRAVTDAWTQAAGTLRSDSSAVNSELPRIALAALLGAIVIMQTAGAPAHDSEFQRFRDQLKQLISLAELSAPPGTERAP